MSWVDIAVGVGGGATAFGVVGSLLVSQLKHTVRRVVAEEVTAEIKTVKDDVTALRLKIARETGGNSNGLRQKLDSVAGDVAELRGVLSILTK